jgi:hypothetical protein
MDNVGADERERQHNPRKQLAAERTRQIVDTIQDWEGNMRPARMTMVTLKSKDYGYKDLAGEYPFDGRGSPTGKGA